MPKWNFQGAMPEYHVQQMLEKQATALGYLWFHDKTPQANKPGFPDLHIVGHGRHWVLELKTEKGEISDAQKKWMHEYLCAGVDARIIRPANLETMIKALQDGFQDDITRRSKS